MLRVFIRFSVCDGGGGACCSVALSVFPYVDALFLAIIGAGAAPRLVGARFGLRMIVGVALQTGR